MINARLTKRAAYQMISDGRRIVELDGLRGLAAIIVVVAHYFGEVPHGVPLWFGWMGVTLFFTLSGFLIGSIILERRDSANFFMVFYVRRAFRILPVYLLVIALVIAFVLAYGSAPWTKQPLPAIAYFTFTQNFVMAATANYGMHWLLPTWTLAVEEQFYLIAPLFIVFIPDRHLLRTIVAGAIAALLSRAAFYFSGHEIAGGVLFFSRADLLLCGVLAAFLYNRQIIVPERVLRTIRALCVVGIIVLGIHARSGSEVPLGSIFNPLLAAAAFASYIISTAQGSGVLKVFGRPTWIWFGTISYCLYLVHQPVNGILHGLVLGSLPDIGTAGELAVTLAALVISIGVAWASLQLFERPLLRLGRSMATYDGGSPAANVGVAKRPDMVG
jgi:peptidoglycan/LPS O-acetylase OafA/YrhL